MTSIYTPELLLTLAVLSLITGAISGVLAGLLGVGGGIVIVPVLFLLFEYLDIPASIAMHLAVATSLATIVPTSISSARSHYKKGSIDIDLFKSWSPFIFVGAAVGGLLSKAFDSSTLSAIFGCVALLAKIHTDARRNGPWHRWVFRTYGHRGWHAISPTPVDDVVSSAPRHWYCIRLWISDRSTCCFGLYLVRLGRAGSSPIFTGLRQHPPSRDDLFSQYFHCTPRGETGALVKTKTVALSLCDLLVCQCCKDDQLCHLITQL